MWPAPKHRRKAKQRPEPLGRIELLVVENFKSYEGRHEIGPFDKFTCIIGPNGAGKSNVMDAISFCLGIRARHLRGDRLKDLVYRREEEDLGANTRSAKVTIVFRTPQGDLLHFGRHINTRGEGTYRFGPPDHVRSLGHDDFIRHLSEQHIYVKARNFLVFQGDVMELARRQGTDLTRVLETISGSEQLKDEYNRLSKELEIVQEKARMYFQHRREIEGAVALLEQQRAEVERWQALRTRRQRLATESALFKVLVTERELERHREVSNGMRSDQTRCETDLRSRRGELDDTEVQRKRAEAEAEKMSSKNFVLTSNLEQVKHEVGTLRKQIVHWESKLREKEAQVQEEALRHGQLEGSLSKKREERTKAEAEITRLKRRQVSSAVKMTDEQRASYDAAVAKTDSMNSRTRERLREAEEQGAQLTKELAADRRDLQDVETGHARGTEKLEELALERAVAERELGREAELLQERRQQAVAAGEDVRKYLLFRDSLLEEHRTLRVQLDAANARKERLETLEVRQRVADELRGAFPGAVLGRISELVLPTQKRFDLPLQMALGGMAEALVVRDAAAGRRCVRYLKEKKISAETFLPLDRMAPPNVGALHLLVQGHLARRLAAHCVQHNEKFLERQPRWRADGPSVVDQTVEFLLNGTIIVDQLEEAKRTSYHDARRCGLMPRVVTLDGEVIAPNGNMSVQCLSPSGRVEFGGSEQLHEMRQQEQKLSQVEKDLTALHEEVSRKRQREAALREEARDMEERRESRVGRLRLLEGARKAEERLVAGRATRAEELKTKISESARRLSEVEQAKEQLERELLTVGKKYFVRLNQELGVHDVREIFLKEQRDRVKLRQEIERQEDYVRTLLSEERNLDQRLRASSKLEALKRDCDLHRRDIEEGKKRQEELDSREKVFEERSKTGRARMQELNATKERLEQDAKNQRAECQRLRLQVEDLRRKLKRQNEKVRVLLGLRCGIFRDCSERRVELPLLAGDGAALEQLLSREQDLDDLPFQDLEAACQRVRVDFAALPQAKKDLAARTGLADAKAVEDQYGQEMASIDRDLDAFKVNMRAPEEFAMEEEKLKKISDELNQASQQQRQLTRDFERVRAERTDRFMKCFKHVETCVNPFYKDLTSYDGFDGGSAYLDLDDAEEPYNGGITFTACPPGKRFFPMELLSGGEKSMASLALLFAMHSYQPPPFMILDEVDAPFDRKNTGSLVGYLKKLDFQCLVISLKDTFFAHSDSIVGIYKDGEAQSSGTLSLPLRRLGEESEAPEAEVPLSEVMHGVG